VFGYSLRQVYLGEHKKSGKPVTTCVVDWAAPDVARAMKGSANGKWPKGLKLVYDAVTLAILEGASNIGPVVMVPLCGRSPSEMLAMSTLSDMSAPATAIPRKPRRRLGGEISGKPAIPASSAAKPLVARN
jgi:hypothetical protein